VYALSRDELCAGRLRLIPQSLPEALAAFEEDPVVRGALGPRTLPPHRCSGCGSGDVDRGRVPVWNRVTGAPG